MNNISDVKSACVGCFACRNICPKNAIERKPDKEGFLYPVVNTELCVDCGACLNVCPALAEQDNRDNRIECYYGASKDEGLVAKSSSGGAFSVLAERKLEGNGIVYGAIFDKDTKSIVYSDTDCSSMDAIRKSKYVASDTRDVFHSVKEHLKKGRKVLFCGLPCHVDGLRLYLAKATNTENLITVDFICGGTASPEFFKIHLNNLESKFGGHVSNVDFRAKLYGWKTHSIKITFDNGKEYKNEAMYDLFFKGYFEKTYQRDSCYKCKYRLHHYADLTIADYWGGLLRNIQNDKGLSMVIANTDKGRLFLNQVFDDGNSGFVHMPVENSDYAFKSEKERYDNAFIKKSEFYALFEKYGFKKTAKKMYLPHVKLLKLKNTLSRFKAKLKAYSSPTKG